MRKAVILVFLAAATVSFSIAEENALAEFHAWASRQGAKIGNVEVRRAKGSEHRVVATAEINAGDILMEIPFAMCLGVDLTDDPVISMIQARKLPVTRTDTLALALIKETVKGRISRFRRYLDMLPDTPSSPLYFTEDELSALDKSALVDQISNRWRLIDQQYNDIAPDLHSDFASAFPANRLTLDKFMWAVAIVFSRAVTMPVGDSKQGTPVLVPYADMFNHRNHDSVFSTDLGNKLFKITATRAYKRGEEVFLSYGEKPNHKLLLDFGFALPDNEYDEVVTSLARVLEPSLLPPESSDDTQLRKVLSSHGLFSYDKLALKRHRLNDELVAACRVLRASAKELELLQKNEAGLSIIDPRTIISEQNEKAALKEVASVINKFIATYKFTDEDDEATLKRSITSNMRYVIVLRHSDREVLHNQANLALIARQNLHTSPTVRTSDE